jgi:cell division protein FtsB
VGDVRDTGSGALARVVPPRLRGVKVPGLAIASVLLLVFAVLSLAPALGTYLSQRQKLADLTAQVARQQADLRTTSTDIARWSDPAYVRSQAGSRLFYVLPGEVAYRVVGGTATKAAGPAQPPTTAVQTTRTDWAGALLDSLVAAGTTSATPKALTGR